MDEIEQKKQNIYNKLFKEYFSYQNPSNMYKKISGTENSEVNKIKVDFIKKMLSKLQKPLIMCQNIKNIRLKRIKK